MSVVLRDSDKIRFYKSNLFLSESFGISLILNINNYTYFYVSY